MLLMNANNMFVVKANLTISDITIKNLFGTTSEKDDPEAGTLVCSAPDVSNMSGVTPARR